MTWRKTFSQLLAYFNFENKDSICLFFFLGIEELKLNALPDDIKYLYCLCELIAEDSNLCVVRLMDEKMNVIIKITGLEVK